MKRMGVIIFAVILFIVGFVVFSFINRTPQNVSPILEENGVKVIYETPSK